MANSNEQLQYLRDMLQRKKESLDYGSFVNPNDNNTFSDFMDSNDISSLARVQTDMQMRNTEDPTEETPDTPEDTINGWKRTIDTIGAASMNVSRGLFNFFDSLGDLFFNVVDAIGGGDVSWAQNARDFDWVSYATNVANFNQSIMNGDLFNGDYFGSFGSQEDMQNYLNKINNESNWLSEAEKTNEFMTGVEESIGFMLPAIVAAIVSGGAASAAFGAAEGANAAAVAASAANVAKAAALGTMAAGSFASSYNEVYEETGNVPKSLAVGALKAGVEVGTELVFPEGKVMGAIGGKTVTATFGQFAKEMGKEFFEEGVEEVMSALAEPFINEIYKEGSIKNAYVDNPAEFFLGIGGNFNESVAGQGLAGGVSGIIMGGVSQAQVNAEVDELVGKDGRKLLAKGQELGELAQKYFEDAAKGKLTNEQLKEKYSDLFGEKGSEWLREWSKLKDKLTTEQKKNFARLIANPAETIRQQIQDTDEDYSKFIERTIKSRSDISKVQGNELANYINKTFNTNISVDFLSEELIKNRDELQKYLGYELTDEDYNKLLTNGEAYNEDGRVVVLNEKFKDEYNRLIAHEALSHGILDSNAELRGKLLSDLSNNKEFYNAWKEYFKSAKNADNIVELYKLPKELNVVADTNENRLRFAKAIETMNSEQMASFVEFIMSNNNLIKTLDNVSSNKLQTIIRRAINKIKSAKSTSLDKARLLLENTLKTIRSQNLKGNTSTNVNRQQMAFSQNQTERIVSDKRSERIVKLDSDSRIIELDNAEKAEDIIDEFLNIEGNNGSLLVFEHYDFGVLEKIDKFFKIDNSLASAMAKAKLNAALSDESFETLIETGKHGHELVIQKIIDALNHAKEPIAIFRTKSEGSNRPRWAIMTNVFDGNNDPITIFVTENSPEVLLNSEANKKINRINSIYGKRFNEKWWSKNINNLIYVDKEQIKKVGSSKNQFFGHLLNNSIDENNFVVNKNGQKRIDSVLSLEQNEQKKRIKFSLNTKADTVRESKYYANSYSTNVISYTNAQQIFSNIVDFLNNHFNITIDESKINNIAKELTIDFNTISSADDLGNLKNKIKIMSMDILDTNLKEMVIDKDGNETIKINEDLTLRKAIKSAGMSDTWFEDFLGDELYKAFENRSNSSRINRVVTEYIDRLNEALLEIRNRKLITYYTIKTQKSMLGLKDKFNKHTFSGTNRKAVDTPLLKYYKEILNNSLKVNIATKSKLGISPKFVNQLLLDLQSYNAQALQEKYDWIELETDLEGNSLVEQYRDALIDSLSMKANPNLELTYEEMEATYNLVGTLSKELSNLIKDEGDNRRKQVRKADLELRAIEKAYSEGKNILDNNVIQQELNKASSPDTVIKNYFGRNSDVYKIVFSDIFDATSNQLLKQYEFVDQYNEIKNKYNITDKVLNKKVEVNFNGKTYNIATKVLLDIYTMSLTEATYKTLTNGGYRFNDGKNRFKIALTESDIAKFDTYLSDDLRSFAEDVLLDIYNGTARDYKSERDAHIKGYKVLLFNDLFYPSNKADTKVSTLEQNDYGVINFENTSINKERKKAYHMPLLGMDFESRFSSYINALTKYGEMSDSLKTLNNFLNGFTKDSELEKPIKRRAIFGNITNNLRTIFDYLYERIGGKNDYVKSGSKFFSNIVQATLYGNPSVVLKQTASLPTILNEVRASSFFKAFKDIPYNVKNYKAIKQELMKHSGFLADRWSNNEIIRAEALTNYLNKFSKIFGVPMEKMDEAVIIAFGYGAAIEESKITGEAPIKILERIVANTQSNAITLKVSMARSGAAGYLRKFLSYFTSDLQNKVSLINNLINEKRIAKKAIVGVESMIETTKAEIEELEELGNEFTEEEKATEEYQDYLDKLEEKKYKLAYLNRIRLDKQEIIDTNNVAKGSKLVLSLVMSGLIIASITELVKRLLGKKDWKWDDETTKDFAITLVLESTINNLPYISTILNSIEYNNKVTGLDISILNQFITILNDLYKQIQGDGDWVSTIKDVVLTLGNMTGLPISNLYKYGVGIYKNVSPNGYKIDAIVQSYSPTYIYNEYKDALEKGMNKKASGYLELVMGSRAESSEEVRKELMNLSKDGYNALPKAYMTSYTNDNGDVVSLTDEQINAFKTEYNRSNEQIEKLMQLTDYSTKTSEERAKLIKKIYDTYYSYAKAKVLKLDKADNKLSTLLYYSNGRISVSKFVNYLDKINSIAESKNKTRKELVIAYVNRLGLSRNDKLLLLYLAGYKSQDTNDKLSRYLRSLGLNSKKVKSFLGVE